MPPTPSAGPPKANAWTSGNRVNSGGASGASSTGTSTPTATQSATPIVSANMAEEKYAPVGGFNGRELTGHMKSVTDEATRGDTTGSARWKAPASADGKAASKVGSPWGQKATAMANGNDFWIGLKKQIAAAGQQGG